MKFLIAKILALAVLLLTVSCSKSQEQNRECMNLSKSTSYIVENVERLFFNATSNINILLPKRDSIGISNVSFLNDPILKNLEIIQIYGTVVKKKRRGLNISIYPNADLSNIELYVSDSISFISCVKKPDNKSTFAIVNEKQGKVSASRSFSMEPSNLRQNQGHILSPDSMLELGALVEFPSVVNQIVYHYWGKDESVVFVVVYSKKTPSQTIK